MKSITYLRAVIAKLKYYTRVNSSKGEALESKNKREI